VDVKPHHRITVINPDHMSLLDTDTGATIVTATRGGSNQPWIITADGVPDVTAPDRAGAIQAMTEQALAALGGSSYTTQVPPGLFDQP